MSFFDAAFQIVVGVEGGYNNDAADPGGETKYGISKRAYPLVDIAALSLDEAKAIYLKDYWDALNLGTKPWSSALLLFDAAVNQGQTFARNLPDDPIEIATKRALRYASISTFPNYGRGWFRRLFTIFRQAGVTP
jgi:lysozyme family protein